jgi:hypothetical protein
MKGGECLSCEKVSHCSEVTPQRLMEDYVCFLFVPVPEPVYWARVHTLKSLGEAVFIEVLLGQQITEGE